MYNKILSLLEDNVVLSITMSSGKAFTVFGYERTVTEKIKSPVIAIRTTDKKSLLFINTDLIESFEMMSNDR
ncbi:hypothetical protein LCAC16_100011 [Leuconostoc carnosum]|nr:hypothetical protein LCAC16_100011 [Leuconostoc carnosum]